MTYHKPWLIPGVQQFNLCISAKLSVCLDELRSIVGDRFSDNVLIDACINNDFNKDRAYDAVTKTASKYHQNQLHVIIQDLGLHQLNIEQVHQSHNVITRNEKTEVQVRISQLFGFKDENFCTVLLLTRCHFLFLFIESCRGLIGLLLSARLRFFLFF